MRSLVLVPAAVLLAAAAALPAAAQVAPMERTVSVVGEGVATVTPDMAIVTVGVVSQGFTASEALTANNEAMRQTIDALTAAGIEQRDIQTANFSINPRYVYSEDGRTPPRINGYEVSNQVTVRIRDIERAGDLLDAVVRVGANSIQGITFTTAEPDAATDEARADAIADARHRAEIYAQAAGVSVGDVLAISEDTSYVPPQPVIAQFARAEAADAVPVQAGEQEIRVTVRVTWALD